jgi:hypothetical protein
LIERIAARPVRCAAALAVAFFPLAALPTDARAEDRNRPAGSAAEPGESEDVLARAAARWQLLSYPTGRIPSQPFAKAKSWIESHVPVGAPWANATLGLRRGQEAALPPLPGSWTFMGPQPIDQSTQQVLNRYGRVTSRFNAVAVDPRTTGTPGAITAYAGATGGGVWKSVNCCDAGTTWSSLWDKERTLPQSVGAIELDPNDPDTLYVGSGDFDSLDQLGEGLRKSTDAGATWTQLGADVFTSYAQGTPLWLTQNIGVVRVDPHDSESVLVGTRYDLYLSHDAGASWTRCPFGANPTDPTSPTNPIREINRISGIVLDSTTSPTTAYVAVGDDVATDRTPGNGDNGVYKGTVPAAGCPALTLVSTGSNGWPAGTGNGTNGATTVGRIRLAASRGNGANNLVLYAQVENTADFGVLGTWVTTNQGGTWTQLAGGTKTSYRDCHGAQTPAEVQDYYNLWITADPANDKTVYIGRSDIYKATVNSTYTSMTLTDLGNVYVPSCAGSGSVHPDFHHAAWISGTGATSRMLMTSDGGVYAADGTVGGFTPMNSTLGTLEVYAGQTGANLAGGGTQYLWAGTQDNGTAEWSSAYADLTWQGRVASDGFHSAFDPVAGTLTAGRWLAEMPLGALWRSTTGASGTFTAVSASWSSDRPFWNTPFLLDGLHCTNTQCPNVVLGAAHVYASVNGGGSWTRAGSADLTKGSGSIYSLALAPSSPTTVVVGTTDGNVQWSADVLSGTNCTQGAANTSTFACTVKTAPTWINLTQGNAILPNRPICGVGFDPTTVDKVYAALCGFDEATPATPGHVFQATNNAGVWTWVDKSGNLPDAPTESIAINPANTNQAFLGTEFGFFYTDDLGSSSPTWLRYPYGLPDTPIFVLAIDRGPAANPFVGTTLTAFTFGRGAFSIRLPGTAGLPPHPVPTTMLASRSGASAQVTWDPTGCPNVDHNLYWGSIGNYTQITGGSCSIGDSGIATSVPVPDNGWWVIVGSDEGTTISSFGTDSSGNQEAFLAWPAVCAETAQNTTTTCP